MKKLLYSISIIISISAISQDQTQNLTFDNYKFIYFRNVLGDTDGVRIGRHTGDALRIRYKGNFLAFDALDNEPVVFKNSSDESRVQIHTLGNSFFNGGNVGIGNTSPDYALDVAGGGRFTEILRLGTDSNGGLSFGNSWNVYSNTSNDSYIVTHSGSGGAEMEIKNVDGTVANAVTIFKSKVGIGVGSPSTRLEIDGKIGIHNASSIFQIGSANNSTTGLSIRSVNNPANPDNIFTVESSGSSSRFGVTQAHGAWILDGLRIGKQFNSNMPDLEGGLVVDGKVAIGTLSVPDGFDFALDGKAIMEEVKVEMSGAWPDYVFESNYNLRSLSETEAYIKENKHLPEVPSAQEVEENGIYLGEMNALLLKKIEELTLYLIEMKEENVEMKSRLETLENSKK